MSAASNMNTYLNNHYQGKTPEQLIQMLYQGALRNITLARQGIKENNPKKRGEHLGKTIAIITELYSSLDKEIEDESIQYLTQLYGNMLTELPKVSLSNDVKVLDLTHSYIKRLNQIWETEVLNKKQPEPNAYKDGQDNLIQANSLFA